MNRTKLKVLLIDDSEDDIFITSHHLRRIETFDLTIDSEINYSRARDKILANEHDLYVIDYLLGPETGLELVRECSREGVTKPFILLTGKGDRDIDLEAAKTGVYDYLTKAELNAEMLERSIRYSMERYFSYIAVAESEFRFREIFNKSTDIIFVVDQDFRLVNFNPMMSKLLGYEAGEMTGQPLSRFFETEDSARKFISHTENNVTNSDIEITLLTRDKARKTFLASTSEITSLDGHLQYQGILYDYTNLKKSLEQRSLDERIEAIGKVVRSMAHEIRNPLTNINLSLHQLEDEVNEDGKPYIDIIKRNSKRINDLIGELMKLSNPTDSDYKPINMRNVLATALDDAIDRINLKGIRVEQQHAAENAIILGDQGKLHMALLNIIINAVEAMEEKGGHLAITTSMSDGAATVTIADNGDGIPSENIPHLFQPYFTGKKNGMGLGLATTHSVIKAHKGSIEVLSTVGIGTTFIVKLPVLTEQG